MKQLLGLELKKTFVTRKIMFIVLLLLVSKSIYTIISLNVKETNFDKEIYGNYMDEISGNYSDDKLNYINDLIGHYKDAIDKEELYKSKYYANMISAEEYRSYINEIDLGKVRLPVLTIIREKLEYFSMRKDIVNNIKLINDINISDYIASIGIDIIMIISIIFIVSRLFTNDYTDHINIFVITSKYGRTNISNIRLGIAIFFSVIMSILLQIVEFVTVEMIKEFNDYDASIQSITEYSNLPNLSIGNFILLVYGIRTLFGIILNIIISFVAKLMRSFIGVFIFTLTIVFIPYFLYDSLPNILKSICISKGLYGVGMFTDYYEIGSIPNSIIMLISMSIIIVGCYIVQRKRTKIR